MTRDIARARAEGRGTPGADSFTPRQSSQIQHLSHMPAGRCGLSRERSERNVKRDVKHVSWECKESYYDCECVCGLSFQLSSQ